MSVKRNHNLAFGLAVREYRYLRSRITQGDLGARAGLDRTFISLLELGHRSPTLNTIVAVSSALNITPVALMEKMQEILETLPAEEVPDAEQDETAANPTKPVRRPKS